LNQPFRLNPPHFAPIPPSLGLRLGIVSLAGVQVLLFAGQIETTEVRQRVVGVHANSPRTFNCLRVASGYSVISLVSRAFSVKPKAGRRSPPRAFGASVPASRRRWFSRVTNETLTQNRPAT